MLCAVCTVHVETRSTSFLVEPQNQGLRFVSGLASKPLRRFVSGLASKPLGRFLPVWAQNQWRRFLLILPQNRWWRFLPVWPENRCRWFSRFDLKTGGNGFPSLGLKTGSFCLVEDGWVNATGCVGSFYPNFAIFYVLGTSDILVFWLLLRLINRTLEGWGFLSLLRLSIWFLDLE
jgi:hypothetical protein